MASPSIRKSPPTSPTKRPTKPRRNLEAARRGIEQAIGVAALLSLEGTDEARGGTVELASSAIVSILDRAHAALEGGGD